MLKIYNTLGRELQEFEPIDQNKVLFYHCGPTVYWTQHIGNMRAMVMADLIRRSLVYLGYDVRFVRNYTDFGHLTGDNIGDADQGEDRMEKAAKRENSTPDQIADKYIEQFDADTTRLNILDPDTRARATEYIEDMILLIKVLIDKEYAYLTPKAVYFDISKFPEYTKLSGRDLSKDRKGAGTGDVSDPDKKDPADFALWFFRTGAHKKALQYWPSPFESEEVENGNGFPGWHIECSAMAMKLLGKTIDIHMGGVEHISIHHPNEIAQSESANDQKYVNYWLHNEHILVDGGKMSKSVGNVWSLDQILEKGYDPMHLRYFYLQAQYRSKQNFTWEALQSARNSYEKLINLVQIYKKESTKELGEKIVDEGYKKKFTSAIEEDFNIPKALAVLWDLTKDSKIEASVKLKTILDFDKVLGLRLDENIENLNRSKTDNKEVKEILESRKKARETKDWKRSDELRDLLQEKYKIEIRDTDDGQEIKDM